MKWDITDEQNWKYDQIPLGVVALEAGNSQYYNTGGWRTDRPIWDPEKCTHCLMCWVNCPDSSIYVEDGQMTGIDLDHCKGCGVCVVACRFDALELMNEEDAKGVQACEVEL